MANLFLSFIMAIAGALGLVTLSHTLNLEMYISRIFPLIPLLYAISYEILEHLKTGKSKPTHRGKMKEDVEAGTAVILHSLSIGRIFTAIGISFCIKIGFEALLSWFYLYFNNTSFMTVYGAFSTDTVSRFIRGDHPYLIGNEGIILLVLVALVASIGTGLWIGYTTKASAVFEGVMVGAAVSVITAMTNMLILYQKIEEMANRMAASMGYGTHIGFIAVISLQVMLYGFWSGLAQKGKYEREERKATKKLLKKTRS